MTANFTKFGNDYALVLGESALQQLQIDPQAEFEVKSANGELVFTPVNTTAAIDSREQKFQEAIADVHTRFGNAMKRLAE